MLFDLLQVGFSAFVCYCLYIAILIPYQEKQRKELMDHLNYLQAIQKEK